MIQWSLFISTPQQHIRFHKRNGTYDENKPYFLWNVYIPFNKMSVYFCISGNCAISWVQTAVDTTHYVRIECLQMNHTWPLSFVALVQWIHERKCRSWQNAFHYGHVPVGCMKNSHGYTTAKSIIWVNSLAYMCRILSYMFACMQFVCVLKPEVFTCMYSWSIFLSIPLVKRNVNKNQLNVKITGLCGCLRSYYKNHYYIFLSSFVSVKDLISCCHRHVFVFGPDLLVWSLTVPVCAFLNDKRSWDLDYSLSCPQCLPWGAFEVQEQALWIWCTAWAKLCHPWGQMQPSMFITSCQM